MDVGRSASFYEAVFGWSVDTGNAGFTAPAMIGQFTTDRPPSAAAGPLLWIRSDDLYPTLDRVAEHGGMARHPQPQTMIAVRDVEASSAWYQQLLGLRSDHGGPEYERLLAGDALVLQLHHRDVAHHHGPIAHGGSGDGVLLWFGEVSDFDGVVARAGELHAPIVRAPHRNPPEGHGNGPGHREIWVSDPDGYTVVVAGPDGEAHEPT